MAQQVILVAGAGALALDLDTLARLDVHRAARLGKAGEKLDQRHAQGIGQRLGTHLDRNDACGFFQPLGDLFVTGPTHTNVNDFRALLIL